MRRSLTADKRWLAWLWLWGMALLTGCYSLAPGRQAVDRIDIQENTQLRDDEIKGKIATGSSPRFLGIWDGVAFEYAYFDRFVLQQDLARIERYYRSKGYYHSRVRAARVIPTGKQGHVRVEIAVHEGPPTIVRSALPSGLNTVPFEHQAAILNAVEKGLKPGDRFDETIYEQTKDRIRAELKNRGFAWAEVEGRVQVNLLDLSATIQYEIKAGPLFLVRSVTFLGIQDLPREPIRRVFNVNPGDSFSAKDLETGKNALLDLGVLADVQVSWPSGDPQAPTNIPRNKAGQPAVDVVVRCTPAPLRTIKLGVGTELDTIRADVHGVAGWESRNFWEDYDDSP